VPTLAVYRGDQFLRHVELGEAPLRIGRAPENELILEDRDKQVSRTHAVIRFERGRYVVQDLKSQNGVWIGDRRVKSDPMPADVPITIGPYRLVLLAEALPTMAVPVEETYLSSDPPPKLEEHIAEPTEPPAPGVPSSQTHRGKAAAPSSRKGLLIAAAAVVAVAAVGAVVVGVLKSRTDQPQVTTTTVPPGPTAEERFQDHFNKAQELIAKPDRAGALAENTEALAALPDDPRGLKQKAEIDAMATPLVDPPLVPEGGTPPPGTAAGPTSTPGPPTPGSASTPGSSPLPAGSPSTLAPTLRVEGRSGEAPSARATREKTAKTLLEEAKKALEDRRYADAIAAAQRAMEMSGRTDFGTSANEASNIVAKAKGAQATEENDTRTANAANAQKLVVQAKALATSGNVLEAINKLRDARMLSPQAVNQEFESNLVEQARQQGEAALKKARIVDVNDNRREEALREFERAVQFLEVVPGGHSGLAYAKQRVTELKAGR
jgi:tetratricopeptide (TPR) repeat protein